VKKEGGLTIVQDPKDSEIQTMPEACLNLFKPDHIFESERIISFITSL
jgi:two-component system chemotaxis response regulator CheB